MGEASYVQTSFLGGEWSQSAQGRMEDPRYRTAMAQSLNGFPTEQGAWTRRGGSAYAQTTRAGAPGRVVTFDQNESNAITLEFTDGYVRFRQGASLVNTSDGQAVSSVSTASPAVVRVPAAWPTGTSVVFFNLGDNCLPLQNRIFITTFIDATHFSLADAVTGAAIDGSTLGGFVFGAVARVLELVTNYTSQSWQNLRIVQNEQQAVLLTGTAPQVLEMTSTPGATFPTFTLSPADFIDGPYLDPFSGSQCTYDAQSGNVSLTYSFQAYSASISYSKGDYVTSSGQGYQSLKDANLNNTPVASPTWWTPVNGGAPVGASGFTASDIGRHIRLFSEPPSWSSGATYNSGAVVKYNNAYFQALKTSTNVIPGTDATSWAVVSGVNYAQWTWGRVLSISGAGLISAVALIGNIAQIANAFNGQISQSSPNCAFDSNAQETHPAWVDGTPYSAGNTYFYTGFFYRLLHSFSLYNGNSTYGAGAYVWFQGHYYVAVTGVGQNQSPTDYPNEWSDQGLGNPTNTTLWTQLGAAQTALFDGYIGADFHTVPKAVDRVTVFPANDRGWGCPDNSFAIRLRGNASAPLAPDDGTLLGEVSNIGQFSGAVTLHSSDTVTTWAYLWIEMAAAVAPPLPDDGHNGYTLTGYIAQIQFFAPNVANGSVVTLQLVGPALLYPPGSVVTTWRAGLYSDTHGWPTCGSYHEGRLWLAGADYNRVDASKSNKLFNFAPTGPDGSVADDNAISYTFNADSTATIFWMSPDAIGIICGTDAGEWLIQATTQGLALTPSNIQAHRVTKADCANIEPARTEHTLAVVQRRKRKVIEYFADIFSGKFTAPNLTEKARHLTGGFIEEIRYQREVTPIIWARCGDGSLIGAVYKRDTLMTSQGPTFCAWFSCTLGSGRIVESIAVGPSQNGTLDALTMVTNDPATNSRHVEVMQPIFEETDNPQSVWLLDDAVVAPQYAVTPTGVTISGLWHLNGKTVTVFALTLDLGDYVVSNGTLTVPYGDGVAAGPGYGLFTQAFVQNYPPDLLPFLVGFTFTSRGKLLRPQSQADTGARTGPGFAKIRRSHYWMLQVVQANGISIGTDFTKLDPAVFKTNGKGDGVKLPALASGVFRDNARDDYSFDSQLCWEITRPVPAIIAAIGASLQTQDA